MKKTNFIILLSTLFAITLISSCGLLDDAGDISFPSDLKKSIDVNETATGMNLPYSSEILLDATADSEIKKYKDKIKSISVNSIKYKISNFTGTAGTTFTGSMAFGKAGQALTISSSLSNVDLQAASNSGAETEVALPQADIDKIAALLKDDKAVTISVSGTLSEAPTSFKLEIIVNAKITANPL